MSDILNNSGIGIRILDNIKVDYSLPKWKLVIDKTEKGYKDARDNNRSDAEFYLGYHLEPEYSGYANMAPDGTNKLKYIIRKDKEIEVDREFFDSLTADDLTFLFDERLSGSLKENYADIFSAEESNLDDSFNISLDEFIFRGALIEEDSNTSSLKGESEPIVNKEKLLLELEDINSQLAKLREKYPKKKPFFTRISTWLGNQDLIIKKMDPLYERKSEIEKTLAIIEKKESPKYSLDVLKFFESVKLITTKSAGTYFSRIEPYLKAIKDAKSMGQTALVQRLLGRIILVKYESILKAYGFDKRISEKQLVDFIKKTEKGISLCYVSNFGRPIPNDVIEKKVLADQLHVFDNYCILHYDPEKKSYKMTAEEREKERIKKNDPILFGVLRGSRDLYYIADWVDEKCDLTLDKFIKTLDEKEENFEIGKVKI